MKASSKYKRLLKTAKQLGVKAKDPEEFKREITERSVQSLRKRIKAKKQKIREKEKKQKQRQRDKENLARVKEKTRELTKKASKKATEEIAEKAIEIVAPEIIPFVEGLEIATDIYDAGEQLEIYPMDYDEDLDVVGNYPIAYDIETITEELGIPKEKALELLQSHDFYEFLLKSFRNGDIDIKGYTYEDLDEDYNRAINDVRGEEERIYFTKLSDIISKYWSSTKINNRLAYLYSNYDSTYRYKPSYMDEPYGEDDLPY